MKSTPSAQGNKSQYSTPRTDKGGSAPQVRASMMSLINQTPTSSRNHSFQVRRENSRSEQTTPNGQSSSSANSKKKQMFVIRQRDYTSRNRDAISCITLPAQQQASFETQDTQTIKNRVYAQCESSDVPFKVQRLPIAVTKTFTFASIVSTLKNDQTLGFHGPQQQVQHSVEADSYQFEPKRRLIDDSLNNQLVHILDGLKIKNPHHNRTLYGSIYRLFSALDPTINQRLNFFSWESEDQELGPHKPTYTYGVKDTIKGASRQIFDAATVIMVIPNKITKGKILDPRLLATISIFETDKGSTSAIQGTQLQNYQQRNGLGQKWIYTDNPMLTSYEIHEGDLFFVPAGYSYQLTWHTQAFIMQLPFLPITQDLKQEMTKCTINSNILNHQAFKSSSIYRRMQLFQFKNYRSAGFCADPNNANVSQQDLESYTGAVKQVCTQDHTSIMSREVENYQELLISLRGINNKHETKNLGKMNDNEFKSYCNHCHGYIETIALVAKENNEQNFYHICCKPNRKSLTFKVIFKDSIVSDSDLSEHVSIATGEHRVLANLPTLNPISLFQVANEDVNESGLAPRGLQNNMAQCGANSVIQMMSCSNSILSQTSIYKPDVSTNSPLDSLCDYINGHGHGIAPSRWFDRLPMNLNNQYTDVNEIINTVIGGQLDYKMFRKTFQCPACNENLQAPDVNSHLEPTPEQKLQMNDLVIEINCASGAITTEGLVKALLKPRLLQQQYCRSCRAQKSTSYQVNIQPVPEQRFANFNRVPKNNVFFLNVLDLALNQGILTIKKTLKIGNLHFEFRSMIMQVTRQGGHFATMGHKQGDYREMWFRDDEQVQPVGDLHKHVLLRDSGVKQQWIPSVIMYQQFDSTTNSEKHHWYRNHASWKWIKLHPEDSLLANDLNQQTVEMNDPVEVLPDPVMPEGQVIGQAYVAPMFVGNDQRVLLSDPLELIELDQTKIGLNADEVNTSQSKLCIMCDQTEKDPYHILIKCPGCENNGAYFGVLCLVNFVRRTIINEEPKYYCTICGINIFEHDGPAKVIRKMMQDFFGECFDRNLQYTGLPIAQFAVLESAMAKYTATNISTQQPQQYNSNIVYHSAVYRSYYNTLFTDARLINSLQPCYITLKRTPDHNDDFPDCSVCGEQLEHEAYAVQFQCQHWACATCFFEQCYEQREQTICKQADCFEQIPHPIITRVPINTVAANNAQARQIFNDHYLFFDIYPLLKLLKSAIPVADFSVAAQQEPPKSIQQQLDEAIKHVSDPSKLRELFKKVYENKWTDEETLTYLKNMQRDESGSGW